MLRFLRIAAVSVTLLTGVACTHPGTGSSIAQPGTRSFLTDPFTTLRAPAIPVNPTEGITLDVPFVAQPCASNWCWAASGEMISSFLGKRVPQTTLVNDRFRRLDIRTSSKAQAEWRRHTLPGWPDLDRFGFALEFSRTPLNFATIELELRINRRPLAYAYGRGYGLGHMVVIVGCSKDAKGKRYLHIQNPDGFGIIEKIRYDTYRRTEGWGRHIRTYYNFEPATPALPVRLASASPLLTPGETGHAEHSSPPAKAHPEPRQHQQPSA